MYSNTSHVIVYRLFAPSPLRPSQIQIHLMLLFIVLNSVDSTLAEYSNTSHVIVYPGWIYYQPAGRLIQIHLMLLFIIDHLEDWEMEAHSNTSHVIVYRLPFWFQIWLRLFKYISCYCLSFRDKENRRKSVNSNTSHVIVYHAVHALIRRNCQHSNTSRVIVYHSNSPSSPRSSGIQIHLMLLFIAVAKSSPLAAARFKYISCYCLSRRRQEPGGLRRIQIHLMLLFIRRKRQTLPLRKYSNTSHVIVYRVVFVM